MNTQTDNYNGWTNYATWRINLEIFDGWNEGKINAEYAQEFAELVALPPQDNTLAHGYVLAFLADVNWHEIAEAVNGAWQEIEDPENEDLQMMGQTIN